MRLKQRNNYSRIGSLNRNAAKNYRHLILKLRRLDLALNIGCLPGRRIGMIYKLGRHLPSVRIVVVVCGADAASTTFHRDLQAAAFRLQK
jgi:hypothetical protein